MPREYSQQSGQLRHNGVLVDNHSYSGNGYAKDQPDMEHVPNHGPIPRGTWHIGPAYKHVKLGDFTMNLVPYGHNAHSRTDFRIHGDSKISPGGASEGCIVVSLQARKRIIANRPMVLFSALFATYSRALAFIFLNLCAISASADGLDRHSLTVLGITPGESTFEDVGRLYGETSQWHTGDAAGAETKMCFRFGSGTTVTHVVFASNSEMAGVSRVVTDIRLYSKAEPFADAQRCTPVLAGQHNLSTPSGLHLGASATEVNKILGKHQRREHTHLVWVACQKISLPQTDPKYEYWSKREGCFEDEHGGWDGKPYYSACAEVTIGFKKGKVTYLELSSTDSVC